MAARNSRPEPGQRLLVDRLKNRADFLGAQRGVRKSAASLTLEACATPERWAKADWCRVGFTASRKVGGAVERNRAKRRLRAAARAVLPLSAQECTDYVLIAKADTLDRPYGTLLEDLAKALAAAHLKLNAGRRS